MHEKIARLAKEYHAEITAVRRHLHQHPELSWQERETSLFIQHFLRGLGVEVRAGIAGYGIIAIIHGQHSPPRNHSSHQPPSGSRTVGLRADIDALPILEKSGAPHASQNSGIMHACGHDGHTATLLGAAKILTQLRNDFHGTVVCVFQPAEENGGGGAKLLRDGALNDFSIDGFFALHAWPYIPVGTIGIREGAMMAAIDDFEIIVAGKSGHAAHPLVAVDPVLIAAHIVIALQSLVTHERHGADPVVLTVTMIHGGTADNVIPSEVKINGTLRTLQTETRERMSRRLVEVAQSVATTFRGTVEVAIERGYPTLINDSAMLARVARVAKEVVGSEHLIELKEPSMGGEDFAYYLQKYPGAMFRLGVGPNSPLHSDAFDFSDAALEIGMRMMAGVAIEVLHDS
jgi:amidohydrolase